MDEIELVRIAAAEFLEREGVGAIWRLHQEAAMAWSAGDALSAEAWADIAEAAENILIGRSPA